MASKHVREMVWALRDRARRRGTDDPEFLKWDAVSRDVQGMTNRQLLAKYPTEMLSVMTHSERKEAGDERA